MCVCALLAVHRRRRPGSSVICCNLCHSLFPVYRCPASGGVTKRLELKNRQSSTAGSTSSPVRELGIPVTSETTPTVSATALFTAHPTCQSCHGDSILPRVRGEQLVASIASWRRELQHSSLQEWSQLNGCCSCLYPDSHPSLTPHPFIALPCPPRTCLWELL
jgi:hypothetical protein